MTRPYPAQWFQLRKAFYNADEYEWNDSLTGEYNQFRFTLTTQAVIDQLKEIMENLNEGEQLILASLKKERLDVD